MMIMHFTFRIVTKRKDGACRYSKPVYGLCGSGKIILFFNVSHTTAIFYRFPFIKVQHLSSSKALLFQFCLKYMTLFKLSAFFLNHPPTPVKGKARRSASVLLPPRPPLPLPHLRRTDPESTMPKRWSTWRKGALINLGWGRASTPGTLREATWREEATREEEEGTSVEDSTDQDTIEDVGDTSGDS